LITVDSNPPFSPPLSIIPSLGLLSSDRGLAIHLDHGHRTELQQQRRPDNGHLAVVLTASGVEFVERAFASVASSIQPGLKLGKHVMAIDRVRFTRQEFA
jgi:hypothetical protein